MDEKLLRSLEKTHGLVVTLEDGILDGGFGEKIASFYGTSEMKVKCYGIKKEFADRYNCKRLAHDNRLDPQLIADDVMKICTAI